MTGQGVRRFDNWKLFVTFPWNGQRHTIISDDELVIFDLTLELVVVEYPKEPIALLAFNIKAPLASPNNEAPPASPNNEAPLTTVEEFDSNYDDSLIIDKETGEDSENSEVSLDEELGEEGGDLYRYDPEGDERLFKGSSDNNNKLTRMTKYYSQHQLAPNPIGTIELSG
ncbi:hypothetical protein ACOSQ4_005056 [Xanthoceras sorbifolium]